MRNKKFIHLYRLLPNMLTVLAICMGITSIRYALIGRFEIATTLVVFAAFLDTIDGRIARFFGSSSDFGAHLDSLADVANFGVSPAIIVYLWSLSRIPLYGVGWAVVLVYVICGILRLARFNVISMTQPQQTGSTTNFMDPASEVEKSVYKHKRNFFVGIPIPAAALLILTPMMSTFKIFPNYDFSPIFIALYTVIIGSFMVMPIPVFAGKYTKIKPKFTTLIVTMVWAIAGLIVIIPWIVIPILSLVYVISMPFVCIYYHAHLKKLYKPCHNHITARSTASNNMSPDNKKSPKPPHKLDKSGKKYKVL